jgi:hypothetical protein
MKIVGFILVFLLLSFSEIGAQHLIGFDKLKVREIIRNEMRGFMLDNSAVNPVFNYLKFVNSAGTKTLLVFFDDLDISTGVRLVSDYSEYSFMKTDFDNKYKKTGRAGWEYKEDRETFAVTIEEKEWYFVVYIKKKTK